MLVASNDYSKSFLEKKRLLLDSCILNDWVTDIKTASVLEKAHEQYSFVFCTISMVEVGFGPSNKSDPAQVEIAKSIYSSDGMIRVDNMELFKREGLKLKDPKKAKFSYNPNHHEWLASRTHLIRLMEEKGLGGKRARELSNDALIFMCAWNSRSAIITNNLKDFLLFNESPINKTEKHCLPCYSIEDLEKSLSYDVSYPENIYASQTI